MNPEELQKKVEEALRGSEEEQAKAKEELKKKAAEVDALTDSDDTVSGEDDSGMPDGPGFMALYTTLMLLLMTFFIVLVSMGKPSEGKFEEGKKSVGTTFKLMGLNQSREALYFMYSVLKIKSSLVKEALDAKDKSLQKKKNKTSSKQDGIFLSDSFSQEEATQLNRFIALGFNISSKDVGEKYLVVKFPNGKVFEKGTAELKWDLKAQLSSFLKIIGTDYTRIDIRVYTSETPNDDTGLKTSLALSAYRASAIADYIAEEQGVSRDKIIPIGYGEYYYGVKNIPQDKKELVELNIYHLWKDKVKKSEKPYAENLDE